MKNRLIEYKVDRIKISKSGIRTKNMYYEYLKSEKKSEATCQLIKQKNNEIFQSLNYAKIIQDSILPNEQDIKNIFPNSFIYSNPKDILCGDFYMFENIKTNTSKHLKSFLLADCTGHGLSGGILTLLCTSLLKESFSNHSVNSPAEALDFVRDKLFNLFRSSYNFHDGMDIAFCVVDPKKNELHFAGANMSCFIMSDGVLQEYKGDKQHIGYNSNKVPFSNKIINIKKGDYIYLCSDGYFDQFGWATKKRFMKRNFRNLLVEINDKTIEQRLEILKTNFLNWKGFEEQTDDVSFMCVKID